MKELYQEAEMELVEFPTSDIITTSAAPTDTNPSFSTQGDEWL